MITPVEEASLAMRSLSPQAIQVIANIAAARPVILDRAVYNVYSTTGFITILSVTFDPTKLRIGDQISIVAYGTASTSGPFSPILFVNQGINNQTLGTPTNITAADTVAWSVRCDLAVTLPNALTLNSSANKQVTFGTNPRTAPNTSFVIGGSIEYVVSDATFSPGVASGGRPTPTTAITNGSQLVATTNPNNIIFSNTIPTQLVLVMNSSLASFTVNGGYILGL